MRLEDCHRFTLVVESADGLAERFVLSVDAHPRTFPELQPYDLCTDPALAAIVRGVTREQAEQIDEQRRQLATDLAHRLIEAMIEAMMESFKAKDTRNGYPQKP